MSADPIIYCLERISDYRDFERLCSALLASTEYPGIDPLGGTGDEGRDAIIRSDENCRKISFAYTVRGDWRTKLASDCKRVHEKGHGPDVFVFACTQALSASEKDSAYKLVSETYGWTLDLFDIERLRVQLVGPQRHLIAQHSSIFTPPFFPQSGGQSIAECPDSLLIDHAIADRAVAVWLAQRLSLAGFRTWCHGAAPLAGENVDDSVRKLIESRAIQYLPLFSNSSLQDTNFVERCTIAAMKENFVLPCSLGFNHGERIPSKVVKLATANFGDSWKTGLADVLARLGTLGIKPSLGNEQGRHIALGNHLSSLVTINKPEPVFANVFPLELPKTMLIYDLRNPLSELQEHELRQLWAFVKLSENRLVAFIPPPARTIQEVQTKHTPEFLWAEISLRDGKRTTHIAKELAWRSLTVACVSKGLKLCMHRRVYYFPKTDSGEWNQDIQHVDGRATRVQLTGERTKGWGDRASPFMYQLAPQFSPQLDHDGKWNVIVKVYVRVTDPQGGNFEDKEIGRRRKIVTKSWWNKEWLARLLGVVQALQTSDGQVEVGEGARTVKMLTKPLTWECPVGLDVLAIASMKDIGEEIAQFRNQDEDELASALEGTQDHE